MQNIVVHLLAEEVVVYRWLLKEEPMEKSLHNSFLVIHVVPVMAIFVWFGLLPWIQTNQLHRFHGPASVDSVGNCISGTNW